MYCKNGILQTGKISDVEKMVDYFVHRRGMDLTVWYNDGLGDVERCEMHDFEWEDIMLTVYVTERKVRFVFL